MKLPIFLTMLVIFCLWLSYEINKSQKESDKQNKAFWDREKLALKSKKVNIESLPLISLSNELPIEANPDKELAAIQNKVKALMGADIINLTYLSNTDIRIMYGNNNFEYLSKCDANYIKLCNVLNSWAKYHISHNNYEYAKKILEYAVNSDIDSIGIYQKLLSIYRSEQASDKIEQLYKKTGNLHSPAKEQIQSLFSD